MTATLFPRETTSLSGPPFINDVIFSEPVVRHDSIEALDESAESADLEMLAIRGARY